MKLLITILLLSSISIYTRSPYQHYRYLKRREIRRQKIEYTKQHEDEILNKKYHDKLRRMWGLPVVKEKDE